MLYIKNRVVMENTWAGAAHRAARCMREIQIISDYLHSYELKFVHVPKLFSSITLHSIIAKVFFILLFNYADFSSCGSSLMY